MNSHFWEVSKHFPSPDGMIPSFVPVISGWKEVFSGVILLFRNKAQKAIRIFLILVLFMHDFLLITFIALPRQNTLPDYNKKNCDRLHC